MSALVFAWIVAVGVALGVLVGGLWAGPELGPWAALAALSALALIAIPGAGWVRRGLCLAGVGLAALLHGAAGRATPGAVEVVGAGAVELEVEGASWPGARCEVVVAAARDARRWRVDAPGELCPLASGDRLLVKADALGAHLAAPTLPWGGREDPRVGASAVITGLPAVVSWRGPNGFDRAVARLRQEAWAASRGWPAGALVVASTLGAPEALPPAEREAIREAGLGHLLAVSGLHVALAGVAAQATLGRLAAWLGWGGAAWLGLCALAPVGLYVGLTGAAPSAVRAAAMLGLGWLGAAVGRPAHGPTALALAAAAMLVVRPSWASDPGLHLSLAAMAALVHPAAPRGLLAQSWRVAWMTLPVALWHFESPAALGVLGNLVAIPVFTIAVLPAGLVGALALPWLGAEALRPASWGAEVILDLAALAEQAPPVTPAAAAWAAIGLGALRLCRSWRWLPPLAVCVAVAAIAGPWRGAWPGLGGAWVAVGGERWPTVIAPAEGASGVCVLEPGIAAGRLGAVLKAVGDPDVTSIAAGRVSEGQVAALRRALARRGRWAPGGECRWPGAGAAREGVRGCLRALGGEVAVARAGDAGLECWADGGWRGVETTRGEDVGGGSARREAGAAAGGARTETVGAAGG